LFFISNIKQSLKINHGMKIRKGCIHTANCRKIKYTQICANTKKFMHITKVWHNTKLIQILAQHQNVGEKRKG
jgi:hypothetical protein